jgi:hypothetical protein
MRDQIPQRGRPQKDVALKLRDQYWTLHLQNQLPGHSLASLERKLLPHLRVTQREFGAGDSQPFSLSKVARGKRGLSPSLQHLPVVVSRAEELLPGAISAFNSVLWSALMKPVTSTNCELDYDNVALEVRSRLFDRHFLKRSELNADVFTLNHLGIRRVARLRHRDALGLLLWHSPAATRVSSLSLTAEAYVFHVLHRSCCGDAALREVKSALVALITERYQLKIWANRPVDSRVFLAPHIVPFSLMLRKLVKLKP